ncbi:MAG TPA: sugar transferase [Micromonosporaceae bacterium]|nr:sugar transferase [Micromonosporaceae bacterium]
MVKRCCDVALSAAALVLLAPAFAVVALVVRGGGPGPLLVRTRRTGRGGAVFTMHKFRTMAVDQGPDPSPLTRPDDPRVLPAGAVLRRLKLDELPQLYDVLRGAMSLVGPRPEDPRYVAAYYPPEAGELLRMRPGLTSPGTLYDYTHGDAVLAGDDPERAYARTLLPRKLALDRYYVRHASLRYDLRLLLRTAGVIAMVAAGRRAFDPPPELAAAQELLYQPR